MRILLPLLFLLPVTAHAGGRAVMEGVWTSDSKVFVDTTNGHVDISGDLVMGSTATASYTGGSGVIAWRMKSFDGTSQSSGCVVAVTMGTPASPSNADPGTMVFTSTTSAAGTEQIGVLLESCAGAAICRVAVVGPVRARMASGSAGNQVQLSGTRCQGQFSGGGNSTLNNGNVLVTVDGNWAWVFLGAR